MTDADRERLCRALGMDELYYQVPCEGGGSIPLPGPVAAQYQDRDDLILEFPPIDTDPTWTLRAMAAASRRRVVGNWDGPVTDWREGWIVQIEYNGPLFDSRQIWTADAETFPEAVCAALLAALDAGALEVPE
ncbi:MAG: hypothetical protein O7A04_09350 [Acidobacteria bacterium]|nr:hypothetical protein [Acidobacteriota bacterium]